MSASPLALKILGVSAVATVGTGGIVLHQTGFFKTKIDFSKELAIFEDYFKKTKMVCFKNTHWTAES